MKYTFTVKNKNTSEQEKFVVEKAPSEVEWHIALKLLGYILFFERKPKIEQDVDWHYRPDLFAKDDMDRVNLWIDCGNIAMKKIERVATKMGKTGEFYILKRTKNEAERLTGEVAKEVKHADRVKMVAFDEGFVDGLAESLENTNSVEFSTSGGKLYFKMTNRLPDYEKTSEIHQVTSESITLPSE